MKELMVVLSAWVVLQAGFSWAQGDSYPVQVAIVPTVELVPCDMDITGLRLNIIGLNRNVTGLDVGLVNETAQDFRGLAVGPGNFVWGNAAGVEVGFINYTQGDMTGFQGIPYLSFWNAANIVRGRATGVQGGLYNQAESMRGFQGGLANVGYDAAGLQIGLYNYAEEFGGVQLGLVNIACNEAHGIQAGLYNAAREFRGLQIGVINQTQVLDGLQIGVLNIATQKERIPYMVIANWQF
jgi:hypothetical protein